MKPILTLILIVVNCTNLLAQSWQACGLNANSNSTYSTALCIHNNKLFASNQSGIYVSTNNGASFTPSNSTILNTYKLLSTGDRLYAITGSFGCSDIFYSTDDGVTFQQDTLGLPVCGVSSGRRPSAGGKAWNQHLILSLDGPDWEWTKKTSDSAWTDAAYFDPNDASEFYIKNDTCWASTNGSTSNGVAWSTDGINWTSPACNGIGNFEMLGQIAFNGNRLFGTTSYDTVLKYSDDFGASFQSISIKQFLDTSAFFTISGRQSITDIFTGYGKIYLCLSQDVLETAPELLVSNNNGLSFEKDTVGFPNNIIGTVFSISDMAFLNGWVFAQVNNGDVYRKQLQSTGLDIQQPAQLFIYPNPAQNQLFIAGITQSASIHISDLYGKTIIKTTVDKSSPIDIAHLPKGSYLVHLTQQNYQHIFKFSKN